MRSEQEIREAIVALENDLLMCRFYDDETNGLGIIHDLQTLHWMLGESNIFGEFIHRRLRDHPNIIKFLTEHNIKPYDDRTSREDLRLPN